MSNVALVVQLTISSLFILTNITNSPFPLLRLVTILFSIAALGGTIRVCSLLAGVSLFVSQVVL